MRRETAEVVRVAEKIKTTVAATRKRQKILLRSISLRRKAFGTKKGFRKKVDNILLPAVWPYNRRGAI